jgi:tetratricopeptide (TPR) repeat protein
LPSVGLCWLAGWAVKCGWDFLGTKERQRTVLRAVMGVLGVALLSLGVAKTLARNRVWSNDRTLYTETAKTDPDSFVMHMNLGIVYFDTDLQASETELLRALELRPNSTNVLNALGCVYLQQGRFAEAEATFQQAIAAKPTWTEPHFNYGRLLKKLGRNDEALAEFRKAVEVGPVNSWARFYLAREFEERGRVDEAETQYRESIRLSPSDSLTAQQHLVDLLLQSGKDDEVVKILQQMATDYPFDSSTRLKLARLYEKQGRSEQAQHEYQRTFTTDPSNVEAKEALKRLGTSAN